MRDDSRFWQAVAHDIDVTVSGLTFRWVAVGRQTLVSGVTALRCFEDTLGTAVGWPEPATEPGYAVALRRDRVLLVDGPVLACGWHDDPGLAVTDMTGGYAVFDLWGADRMQILKRGMAINPDLPSRSAARLFGGLGVIVYTLSGATGEERLRFHVGRSHAPALVQTVLSFLNKLE